MKKPADCVPAAGSADTEPHLVDVPIGERRRLDGPVHLAPYDAAWPKTFDQLAELIRGVLGEKVMLLEHVGSTSVPGLSAKPVIDLLMAVADARDESSYVTPLEEHGFVLRIREPAWFDHRLLKTPRVPGNLHVFSSGCQEIHRMITFRDRLRSHEEDRRRYEEEKHRLAARTWRYTQDYADAKSGVVEEILARGRGRAGMTTGSRPAGTG